MELRGCSLSPNLHITPYDLIQDNVDITSETWHRILNPIIEQHDVIVFDNWYALSQTVEAGAQNIIWKKAFRWMKSWVSHKKTFILLHHSTKMDGGMRGSSDMFNDCDTIIQNIANPNAPPHLSIQCKFIKGRRIDQKYKAPFQLDLIEGEWTKGPLEPKAKGKL